MRHTHHHHQHLSHSLETWIEWPTHFPLTRRQVSYCTHVKRVEQDLLLWLCLRHVGRSRVFPTQIPANEDETKTSCAPPKAGRTSLSYTSMPRHHLTSKSKCQGQINVWTGRRCTNGSHGGSSSTPCSASIVSFGTLAIPHADVHLATRIQYLIPRTCMVGI